MAAGLWVLGNKYCEKDRQDKNCEEKKANDPWVTKE
jgi:hypothetical protein